MNERIDDSSPALCWVPWPDQEPIKDAAYLVFMRLPYQWEVAYYDGRWYPGAGDAGMITHWMPLPAAPNASGQPRLARKENDQ